MNDILKINDQEVTGEDLLPLLRKYNLLSQLAREMIVDQALSEAEIELTTEELNIARQQFLAKNQISNDNQLQNFLKLQHLSLEQLEEQIGRQVKLEKFKETNWQNKLEAYFLQRKGQLDQVVYSLIRSRDSGLIQELYFRIQEGESSFAELARQYSQGSEAQTGGLIGPVELHVPHPKIAQLLSSSQPGQLLTPTRIEDWFVILRLEKQVPAQLDSPTRYKLQEELFNSWLNDEMAKKVSFQ